MVCYEEIMLHFTYNSPSSTQQVKRKRVHTGIKRRQTSQRPVQDLNGDLHQRPTFQADFSTPEINTIIVRNNRTGVSIRECQKQLILLY